MDKMTSKWKCSKILLAVGVLMFLGPVAASSRKLTAAKSTAFLQDLPLNIVLTTPEQLGTSGTAYVQYRQAITVVFSRPVIALGSDFNSNQASQVPFRLTCNVPGKTRWVTTTIARFDPDVDWPTDLSCSLKWNTNLKTYDGARLQLGSIAATRPVASPPLWMGLSYVESERAANVTGGEWNAELGVPGDKLPEVPPDGKLHLSFNATVNLRLLSQALKLYEGRTADSSLKDTAPLPFTLRPCFSTLDEAPGQASPPPPPSLDVNDTCAIAEVGASLKLDTWYTLRLPKGSKYFSLAGASKKNRDIELAGLRRFRLPFRYAIPANDISEKSTPLDTLYRRFDMWLPHGLARGLNASALARNLRLCQLQPLSRPSSPPVKGGSPAPAAPRNCSNVPFTLTLEDAGTARIAVPSVAPGVYYRIFVSADATVKDGFGLPLEASSGEFGMSYISYAYVQPTLPGILAVLEAGADNLTAWPYITRAPPPPEFATNWPAKYIRNISSYTIDPANDKSVLNFLRYVKDYGSSVTRLGSPALTLPVPARLTTPGSGADWEQVELPLGTAKLQLAYACCTPWYYSDGPGDPTSALVLRTSLSVSAVVAGQQLVGWVTDAAQGGGAGVANANVSFYALPYNPLAAPSLAASCKTDASGSCMATIAQASAYNDGARLVAVVKAPPSTAASPAESGPRYGLLQDVGSLQSPSNVAPFLASLVFDRMVVAPGDTLKITGFVQQQSATGLSLPPTSYALIQVSPNWSGGYNNWPQVVAKINGSTGTFHAELSVPASARLSQYALYVSAGSPAVLNEPDLPVDGYSYPWTNVASTYFTVADPRPPTAELKLDAPPFVLPNDTLTLTATAVSYIGASVAGSPVSVSYYLDGKRVATNVTTDLAGVATFRLDLTTLTPKQRENLYGGLTFYVDWVGPTRDLISENVYVSIVEAPAVLTLFTSYAAPLPGVNFTVSAALASNADGSPFDGLAVAVTLKPDPDAAKDGNAPSAACAAGPLPSCTAISGDLWWGRRSAGSPAACRIALPCVGRFILEGCAQVPALQGAGAGSVRVCSQISVGRGAADWAARPLEGHTAPSLQLDKPGGYLAGETPVVAFESPYAGARLLLVWGSESKVRTKVVTSLPVGDVARVPLEPLGSSECPGACSIRAVLDVPRIPAAAALPSQAPAQGVVVSRLFDPRAPHSEYLSADISLLPDNELPVGVSVKAVAAGTTVKDADGAALVAIEPGSKAEITVAVGTNATVGPVEVTVYAVDKAFLDLVPYDLPRPQQELAFRLYSWLSSYGVQSNRIAPGAVRTVFQKLLARLTQQDPWIALDTQVSGAAYSAAVDTPDDEYLALFASSITFTPGSWWRDRYDKDWPSGGGGGGGGGSPLTPSMAAAPPGNLSPGSAETGSGTDKGDNGSGSGGSGSSSSSSTLSVRRTGDFVVTPLFATAVVGPDGKARVNFTAPQNLGAFVIRAFAAAGASAKYGSGEGKVVVRRQLSLTPSAPRFVRTDDTFEAGVVVTVGSAPATVSLSVQLLDGTASALQLTGATVKTYTFAAGEDLQQEIRFSFKAVRIGTGRFLITASDAAPGGGQDALEVEVPVLGKQGDVWVATSFALAANATSLPAGQQWQEGVDLPAATPGSGGLTLTAGVGNYPGVCSVYDNLLLVEAAKTERYAYAPTAVLWATLPAVQSYYGQSVGAGGPAANVTQAFADLHTLTDTWLGLMWTDPARWDYWRPQRADIFLNAWASYLVGYHAAALQPIHRYGPPTPLPAALAPWAADWADVRDSLAPSWRTAAAVQLVADASEARTLYNSSYSDWDTLAWFRLALGATWSPPDQTPSKVKEDLALARTCTGVRKGSRQSRLVLSLALQALGSSNPDPALVNSTLREITSALRVQGRTAYVAAGQGAANAAPLLDQALSLLLLVRSGATHQLLPKLAAYVASPTSSSGGVFYYYAAYTDQALAVLALSEYDRARGSSQPTVDLTADANGLTVLKASFRANKTSPVSNTTAWEDLPPAPTGQVGRLNFLATGTGEVSVAASLHFVPSTLASFPTYRGLYVESVLQAIDPATGRPAGKPLASVPLGSLVAYTVQLTSPDDLGAVTLSVMMPGGLEPLDPNVASDAGYSCDLYTFFGGYGLAARLGWYWPVCPSQETRPSVVTYNYAALRAGTVSVVIKAVAATPGSFLVPAIRAWVDEQPELMGMTAPGRVDVCSDCSAPTYAAPPSAPKSCPKGCSDNGVCNLLTGACLCDWGYSGADCATAAA